MSLPVATISGIDSLAALAAEPPHRARRHPMTPEAMLALRRRCTVYAADGHLGLFKSTKRYYGVVGRQQHGYPRADQLHSVSAG